MITGEVDKLINVVGARIFMGHPSGPKAKKGARVSERAKWCMYIYIFIYLDPPRGVLAGLPHTNLKASRQGTPWSVLVYTSYI